MVSVLEIGLAEETSDSALSRFCFSCVIDKDSPKPSQEDGTSKFYWQKALACVNNNTAMKFPGQK